MWGNCICRSELALVTYAISIKLLCVGSNKLITIKPVLSGHSKEDRKLVFKTNYRLMQVKSIVECSKRAFCNTFDLH